MNIFWCFLFLSIALINGKAIFTVPPEYAGNILKAAADCIESTEAGADAIQKVVSGNLEDSEPFKKFLFCFSSKSGYVDNNGHFVVNQMTKLLGNYKDQAKFIDVLNQCNKSQGDNVFDTTYQISVCFKDNTPVYFNI